jgi:serine protease AprX
MRRFNEMNQSLRIAIRGSITLALVAFFALSAFARNAKLSPDFDKVDSNTKIHVIVRYKTLPQDTNVKAAKGLGGELKFQHKRIKAASFKIKRSQLEKLLASDPNILSITPDRVVKSMNDFTSATVGANIANQLGFQGAGVGIAVLDSGIMDHRDLKDKDGKNSRIVYSESFVGAASPSDKNGHGTHVAGIIGGNGASSTCATCTDPIVGIAPQANLINLQVLDANGSGSDSATIAGIERAIELKGKYNIRVINLSLGRPVYESYTTDPLCQAVEQAWQAGIVVVVSAGNLGRGTDNGNNGYGSITAPGNDPYVITVGAMKADGTDSRSDDEVASYSSKGPTLVDHIVKPDIVAPGNKVESLFVPDSTLALEAPDAVVPVSEYNPNAVGQPAYFRMSGTSMAAPVVAAAAALLIEKQPSLTPDQVKAQLMETATRNFPAVSTVNDASTGAVYTSQYDPFTVGAGYLDIQNALSADPNATANVVSAKSPNVTRDELTGTMQMAGAAGSVWDSTTLASTWGGEGVSAEGIIWGGLNVSTNAATVIWSEGIIWGGATGTQSEGIIWGGANGMNAEGIIWGGLNGLGSEGIIWGGITGLLGE